MEIAFLIFGIAFFLFVLWIITHSERESYNREVREMREFGFRFPRDRDKSH